MNAHSTSQILGLAFGFGLMLTGFSVFKRSSISIGLRVVMGLAMILAGAALMYWLVRHHTPPNPFLLGTAIALLGLGVNQAATPLRVAMGRSA